MSKKIKYDNEDILDISDTDKLIIENDVAEDFDTDIKRRLKYIVEHKKEQCFKRLWDEWVPKLRDRGQTTIPTGETEFVSLVTSQPDYKNAAQRAQEIKA